MIYEHTITVLLHTHRADAKQLRPARAASVFAAIRRWVKRLVCKMGCIFCLFAFMEFYGGFVEGTISWSGALLMCATCIWTCRNFYWLAGGEKLYQRRMLKQARRRQRRQRLKAGITKMVSKLLESNGKWR